MSETNLKRRGFLKRLAVAPLAAAATPSVVATSAPASAATDFTREFFSRGMLTEEFARFIEASPTSMRKQLLDKFSHG